MKRIFVGRPQSMRIWSMELREFLVLLTLECLLIFLRLERIGRLLQLSPLRLILLSSIMREPLSMMLCFKSSSLLRSQRRMA
ncbi:hypothetical protein BKH36_06000 [Actinomyces naeslundii]|nr:hypothetical protein BKH36_06000 [Actinomyces naeslundii]